MKKIIQFEEQELLALLRSLYKDEGLEDELEKQYATKGGNGVLDLLIVKLNLK